MKKNENQEKIQKITDDHLRKYRDLILQCRRVWNEVPKEIKEKNAEIEQDLSMHGRWFTDIAKLKSQKTNLEDITHKPVLQEKLQELPEKMEQVQQIHQKLQLQYLDQIKIEKVDGQISADIAKETFKVMELKLNLDNHGFNQEELTKAEKIERDSKITLIDLKNLKIAQKKIQNLIKGLSNNQAEQALSENEISRLAKKIINIRNELHNILQDKLLKQDNITNAWEILNETQKNEKNPEFLLTHIFCDGPDDWVKNDQKEKINDLMGRLWDTEEEMGDEMLSDENEMRVILNEDGTAINPQPIFDEVYSELKEFVKECFLEEKLKLQTMEKQRQQQQLHQMKQAQIQKQQEQLSQLTEIRFLNQPQQPVMGNSQQQLQLQLQPIVLQQHPQPQPQLSFIQHSIQQQVPGQQVTGQQPQIMPQPQQPQRLQSNPRGKNANLRPKHHTHSHKHHRTDGNGGDFSRKGL